MLTPFTRVPFDFAPLASLFDGVLPETPAGAPAAQRPALDLTQTDDGYELRVDMPGVCDEDVELSVHDDLVTLRAERATHVESSEEGAPRALRVERTQSVFERRLRLPHAVDAERVEAHLDQGVLSVRLPLASHATPRKVPVLSKPNDTMED